MTPPAVAVLNGELQTHDRGYEVNGIHSPSAVAAHLLDDDTTVVVVDVIRCTTTLTGVLAAGAAFVQVLAKTDDDDVAPAIARRHVDLHGPLAYVLAGEKHGKPIPGGAFSNSVLEVPADLQGTGVYFFSTNLGRALAAVTDAIIEVDLPATPVVVATMANLDAVAATVLALGRRRTVIACGGFYDRLSLEDAVAGGRLLARLGAHDLDDGAEAMAALAARYPSDLALVEALHHNRIGKALVRYGRAADIAAAITGDGVAPDLARRMAATVGRVHWLDAATPIVTTDTDITNTVTTNTDTTVTTNTVTTNTDTTNTDTDTTNTVTTNTVTTNTEECS